MQFRQGITVQIRVRFNVMQSKFRWLILALVSCALFLIVIDMTVLYTALPRLTHDLGASASEKLWIINAYSLVVAGLLPGCGTLGDRLGPRPLFVGGLVVFGVASVIAAFSPTPAVLIAARVLLAVGGAMMMPATLSILRNTFEEKHEQAFAIGVWSAVASGGAALGPVIGGVLLEHFWWGSVFLINVPVIMVVLPLTLYFIPSGGGQQGRAWDLLGSVQIMIGLVGVTYAVKELAKREPSFQAVLLTAMLGIAFIVLFVRRQRKAVEPLIDFSLFGNGRFAAGVTAALTASVAMIGMQLVLSQRLQLVQLLSPLQAGLFMLPIPLGSFVAGPVAGWLLPRLGTGKIMSFSLLFGGISLAGLALWIDAPAWFQIVCLALLGMTMGAAMTAASSAIMLNAPAERAGMAASVEEVSYELGGALGVTLMGSLLSFAYTATIALPVNMALPAMVRDSLDEALIAAEALAPDAAAALALAARSAFDTAYAVVLGVAAIVLLCAAAAVNTMMRRPHGGAAGKI